jgi:hypothetical protein
MSLAMNPPWLAGNPRAKRSLKSAISCHRPGIEPYMLKDCPSTSRRCYLPNLAKRVGLTIR